MNDSKILINRNDRLPRAIISNFNRCVLCFASIFSPISLLYTCVCVCAICVSVTFPMPRFFIFWNDIQRKWKKVLRAHERIFLRQSFHLLMNTIQYFRSRVVFIPFFFFFFVRHRLSIRPTLGRMLYTHFKFIIAFEILFFFSVWQKIHLGNGCRRPTSKAAAQIPIKNYYVLFVTFVPLLQSDAEPGIT